jgi:two-component system cell cycle sensor histidine kinase/response regulator CckA
MPTKPTYEELRRRVRALERAESERQRAETARRESEARYRNLFEQAADAIVVFDPRTTAILDFNDAACRRLGYTRAEFAKLKISDFDVVRRRRR